MLLPLTRSQWNSSSGLSTTGGGCSKRTLVVLFNGHDMDLDMGYALQHKLLGVAHGNIIMPSRKSSVQITAVSTT
jgi:hypothetical protein